MSKKDKNKKPLEKIHTTSKTEKITNDSNPSTTNIQLESNHSPQRKRLFYILMIALPFLLIGVLELGLRIFNYGPDLSLFIKKEIHGTTYYVMNPMVRARYFADTKFTPETTADYFTVPKPQGTFRIFCLGGSTAAGFPYWRNASFASFLHERLNRLFPEKKIEVINIGMTAINSFTVLDIAQELPAYEPDLLIVYDGHNEFYGGLGVTSNLTISDSRWVTLLYLKLLHSRVFLLIRETVNGIKSLLSSKEELSTRNITLEHLAKEQYIPYGSELYEKTKNVFKENMEDLRSICREHKIPVILSTQVSNLRDMPPFVSIELNELSAENKSDISKHAAAGISAWDKKNWNEALKEFNAVVKIDTQHAGAHFAIAQCLKNLGRLDEARSEYFKARDYDQLRLRTTSDFNCLIQQMGDNKTVNVIDMERLFMAQSPDSLIGNDILLEHVHPNSYGYFLMAKGYASVMRKHGILASQEEWVRHDTVQDEVLWNDRLVTEIDERIAARRTEILISGRPFKKQPQKIQDVVANDTLGQIAEHVVDGNWGWISAHEAVAEYYSSKQDWENVEREYKTIINLNTLDVDQYLNLADFYFTQGKIDEARIVYQNSLSIESTMHANRMLGDIAFNMGKTDEAIKFYETTRNFQQSKKDEMDNGYQLATAYVQKNQLVEAESELLHLLNLNPNDVQAESLLLKVRMMMNTRSKNWQK